MKKESIINAYQIKEGISEKIKVNRHFTIQGKKTPKMFLRGKHDFKIRIIYDKRVFIYLW